MTMKNIDKNCHGCRAYGKNDYEDTVLAEIKKVVEANADAAK